MSLRVCESIEWLLKCHRAGLYVHEMTTCASEECELFLEKQNRPGANDVKQTPHGWYYLATQSYLVRRLWLCFAHHCSYSLDNWQLRTTNESLRSHAMRKILVLASSYWCYLSHTCYVSHTFCHLTCAIHFTHYLLERVLLCITHFNHLTIHLTYYSSHLLGCLTGMHTQSIPQGNINLRYAICIAHAVHLTFAIYLTVTVIARSILWYSSHTIFSSHVLFISCVRFNWPVIFIHSLHLHVFI